MEYAAKSRECNQDHYQINEFSRKKKKKYRKKKIQAVNYSVNVEDGLPIFTQNIQADIPFQVNIGVVNLFGYLLLSRFDNRKSKLLEPLLGSKRTNNKQSNRRLYLSLALDLRWLVRIGRRHLESENKCSTPTKY